MPGGAVRVVREQAKPADVEERRPFRSVSLTVAASTLGGSASVATPLASRIELRGGINLMAFGDGLSISGMDYETRIHMESAQATIDWFPLRGSGFHISPGVFYFRNSADSAISVASGQIFYLGDRSFTSSATDPVNGSAAFKYARQVGPMLTVGYVDAGRGRGHISIPMEIGAAYTGPAQISMLLNGTACEGPECFGLSGNPDVATDLNQQVEKINHYLGKVPVYPIFSIGVRYHLGGDGVAR